MLINRKIIFSCDFENNKFDFSNLKFINAETASIDRYLQSVDIDDEEELQGPICFSSRISTINQHFADSSISDTIRTNILLEYDRQLLALSTCYGSDGEEKPPVIVVKDINLPHKSTFC